MQIFAKRPFQSTVFSFKRHLFSWPSHQRYETLWVYFWSNIPIFQFTSWGSQTVYKSYLKLSTLALNNILNFYLKKKNLYSL